jgi:hypothetical protein
LVRPASRAPSSPRRGSGVLPRAPSARRQGSVAPRRRPLVPPRVRRRFWLPGREACPALRPSDPRPRRRDRLACPLTPRVPRLRQSRGGRREWPLGGRAVAGPWAGALGERLGLRVHAVPVVASRRRGVAWAGRPWKWALETSGRQERRGAMDDAAGVRQDRPGRAAHRVGRAVRGLDGFPGVPGLVPPELVARRLGAAPPWPRGPGSAGPWRQARAGLVELTPVWPRSALLAWPRLVAPVWPPPPRTLPRRAAPTWPQRAPLACPRPTASAWPRRAAAARPWLPVSLWPRRVASGEALGVGRDLPLARPVPFGTRWAGLANSEAGRGAVGLPRVGPVQVRMPGWTPTGRRGVALGPGARSGDLRGGR